jgi:hypothetical protein
VGLERAACSPSACIGASTPRLSPKRFAFITFNYSRNRNFFFTGSPKAQLEEGFWAIQSANLPVSGEKRLKVSAPVNLALPGSSATILGPSWAYERFIRFRK